MAYVFLLLSLLFGALALHPFVTYPLSLRFLKRQLVQPLQPSAVAEPLTYAVCMCAYNEEAVIVAKAENLRELQRRIPGLQVHIYVDAASDRTAELLQPYQGEFDIHVSSGRHGKTYGMNLLVSRATAGIIIFTDANVMLQADSIPALGRYFSDPKVGCVCGHLKYVNADSGETAANGSLYWRLEEFIKQLESDTGSVMGADGSIFAIRRALHQAPPPDIIDDMYVSFSILCAGYRVVRASDVVATEESVTLASEEFRRKVRIACQAFNVHRLMWPKLSRLDPLNLYKYISHKLLRWFVLLWLVLAVLSLELALLAAGLTWVAMALPLLAVGGLWGGVAAGIKPFPQIADILTAFAGTALGIWRSVAGERFQTWAPAQSIRQSK